MNPIVIDPWKVEYQRNEKSYKFMQAIWPDALTFDDVTIVPLGSEVKPSETNVRTYFSRNVRLNIPIVSAAMDKVTGLKMARMMAMLGGLGIIHRAMDKEDQGAIVERTKYSLNVLLETPITFHPENTVRDILKKKKEHDYEFNSFPIVNQEGKLVGLVTGHHMTYVCDNLDTTIESFMTRNVVTGKKGMDYKEAYAYMKKEMLKKLPLADDDGILTGMYDWDDLKKVIQHENTVNVDSRGQLAVGAAVGVHDYERADLLVSKRVNVLVVDSAHGHAKDVIATVRELKRRHPDTDVVAGNIATTEAATDLIDAGADGLKVGIGPGGICTTRVVSGVGVPQVTAVYDVCEGAQGRVPVNADGGIRYSGDITKSMAAGAQSVMLGTMLAGTDESPGEEVIIKGRKWKEIRGMGSLSAMQERKEARERYGQEDTGKLIPEGIEGIVPYKGKLEDVIYQLVGGLRVGMGYVGAKSIQDLNSRGTFRRGSTAGLHESHPHDVIITKEAPNYQAPTE